MRILLPAATILLVPFTLICFQTDLAVTAEQHLFAARFDAAADAYRTLIKDQPTNPLYHDRLVRSLLSADKADEAYAAAAEAERLAPGTAPATTALGRVAFRKGDFARAEMNFKKAISLDPKYPDALAGMSDIYQVVSQFKRATALATGAFALNPHDTELLLAHTGSSEAAVHESELKSALAILDPASHEARSVRIHLARDSAMKGRKKKLIAAPDVAKIKLARLEDGPHRIIGVGIDVRLNNRVTVHLKFDTGASGISISPQAAKRAGLEPLTEEGGEAHGLGDKTAGQNIAHLADHLSVGPIQWENFIVSTFRAAKESEADGLIGADVFSAFRVTVDFPTQLLTLEKRTDIPADDSGTDAARRPEGFSQIFRVHHMLLIPTSVNNGPFRLFLLDSGAMLNLIDIAAAKDSTKVRPQDLLKLRGVQGEVKDVRSADKGTLVFAGFRQENPGLIAVDLHRMADDVGVEISGVLGMPVLWHMRMSIDYASGSIRLERSTPY